MIQWVRAHPKLSVVLLFTLLTVVYFRYALIVPLDALLTRSLASDLYMHFLNMQEFPKWLGQGILPEGDFWVPRGGGYPAVPQTQLLMPTNLLFAGLYAITHNAPLTLRIATFLFYFANLITSYWYGTTILKRKDASIIFAVAYSFGIYNVVQLEHPELLSVPALIMLTLIFLEKTLTSKRNIYPFLTALSLYLVFRAQLYPFYYTVVFIGARLYFQWQREAFWKALKVGTLFLLAALPYSLTMLLNTPSQAIKSQLLEQLYWTSQPPFLYFVRSVPQALTAEDRAPMYLGLSVVVLALLPIIFKTANRMYAFYLFVTIAAIFYSSGRYGPFELASLVQQYAPFAFFLRISERGMIIGYMTLAMCAAFGFALLSDKLKQFRWKSLLLVALVPLIFADLSVGYEPVTTSVPFQQQRGAYGFLRKQTGDFRVIEMPATYLQMAVASIQTDHDVISQIEWGHGFFEPSFVFCEQYHKYAALTATEEEAAFYGLKYILLNTDPDYYDELRLCALGPPRNQVVAVKEKLGASKDYKPVYSEEYIAVYENLKYRGLVFSDNPTTNIQYERPDPNTLVIHTQSPTPANLIVSQSYIFGWVATVNGKRVPIHENNSVQELIVPAGKSHIVLHYQRYEDWLLTALAFYLTLAILVVGLLWKRRVWSLLPFCGVLFVAFPLTSYTYTVPLYQIALLSLGALLMVGPALTYLVRRLL